MNSGIQLCKYAAEWFGSLPPILAKQQNHDATKLCKLRQHTRTEGGQRGADVGRPHPRTGDQHLRFYTSDIPIILRVIIRLS